MSVPEQTRAPAPSPAPTGPTAQRSLQAPESFEGWWREVQAAALVGTARRSVPALGGLGLRTPERSDEALLAAAALGGTAVLAGRHAEPYAARPAAADDGRAEAPRRAVQLLELVLTQPPAGAEQRDALLLHWLHACDRAGCRVPHALLPNLLDLATTSRRLRAATAAVLAQRGEWLAAQRQQWGWAGEARAAGRAEEAADPQAWALLPSAERPAVVARLRGADPAAGRALVESTWDRDSAGARRAHLEALRVALGPDDEELLERALDDRAASVREVASALLDALPESARAARMADRLRPLLHQTGVLKRGLEVTLPDEPDPSGRRDGLTAPPRGRSARGWWLERIAAGAPLTVWTTATGADPATTLSRLSEPDALSGIRTAARERRDREWAAALLGRTWDPALLPALTPAERETALLSRLAAGELGSAVAALGALSAPWSARFSLHVLAALGAAKAPAIHVAQAMPHLLAGLHPDALGPLESWLARLRDDRQLATQLRNLLQFHSVKRSITEAFR